MCTRKAKDEKQLRMWIYLRDKNEPWNKNKIKWRKRKARRIIRSEKKDNKCAAKRSQHKLHIHRTFTTNTHTHIQSFIQSDSIFLRPRLIIIILSRLVLPIFFILAIATAVCYIHAFILVSCRTPKMKSWKYEEKNSNDRKKWQNA